MMYKNVVNTSFIHVWKPCRPDVSIYESLVLQGFAYSMRHPDNIYDFIIGYDKRNMSESYNFDRFTIIRTTEMFINNIYLSLFGSNRLSELLRNGTVVDVMLDLLNKYESKTTDKYWFRLDLIFKYFRKSNKKFIDLDLEQIIKYIQNGNHSSK